MLGRFSFLNLAREAERARTRQLLSLLFRRVEVVAQRSEISSEHRLLSIRATDDSSAGESEDTARGGHATVARSENRNSVNTANNANGNRHDTDFDYVTDSDLDLDLDEFCRDTRLFKLVGILCRVDNKMVVLFDCSLAGDNKSRAQSPHAPRNEMEQRLLPEHRELFTEVPMVATISLLSMRQIRPVIEQHHRRRSARTLPAGAAAAAAASAVATATSLPAEERSNPLRRPPDGHHAESPRTKSEPAASSRARLVSSDQCESLVLRGIAARFVWEEIVVDEYRNKQLATSTTPNRAQQPGRRVGSAIERVRRHYRHERHLNDNSRGGGGASRGFRRDESQDGDHWITHNTGRVAVEHTQTTESGASGPAAAVNASSAVAIATRSAGDANDDDDDDDSDEVPEMRARLDLDDDDDDDDEDRNQVPEGVSDGSHDDDGKDAFDDDEDEFARDNDDLHSVFFQSTFLRCCQQEMRAALKGSFPHFQHFVCQMLTEVGIADAATEAELAFQLLEHAGKSTSASSASPSPCASSANAPESANNNDFVQRAAAEPTMDENDFGFQLLYDVALDLRKTCELVRQRAGADGRGGGDDAAFDFSRMAAAAVRRRSEMTEIENAQLFKRTILWLVTAGFGSLVAAALLFYSSITTFTAAAVSPSARFNMDFAVLTVMPAGAAACFGLAILYCIYNVHAKNRAHAEQGPLIFALRRMNLPGVEKFRLLRAIVILSVFVTFVSASLKLRVGLSNPSALDNSIFSIVTAANTTHATTFCAFQLRNNCSGASRPCPNWFHGNSSMGCPEGCNYDSTLFPPTRGCSNVVAEEVTNHAIFVLATAGGLVISMVGWSMGDSCFTSSATNSI